MSETNYKPEKSNIHQPLLFTNGWTGGRRSKTDGIFGVCWLVAGYSVTEHSELLLRSGHNFSARERGPLTVLSFVNRENVCQCGQSLFVYSQCDAIYTYTRIQDTVPDDVHV